jgi:hypothetical protein
MQTPQGLDATHSDELFPVNARLSVGDEARSPPALPHLPRTSAGRYKLRSANGPFGTPKILGRGPACHGCLRIAETSCEIRNLGHLSTREVVVVWYDIDRQIWILKVHHLTR